MSLTNASVLKASSRLSCGEDCRGRAARSGSRSTLETTRLTLSDTSRPPIYDSSVQLTGRVALEDIDDVGGKKILKGESVLCLLGSANRDPSVYPDRPDRLDISRPDVRPLSFGGGIHFCLGAQLARIESEIAIATLLRRLPNLRLDDAEKPEWRPTFVLRGLKRLPASW